MLINFTVQNYKSFKDRSTLSLEPIGGNNKHALPFAAIYGPNASGKTNLMKAFAYMQFAMSNENAISQATVRNPGLQPFLLNKSNPKEPILFEATFYDKSSNSTYRYGFEVQNSSVKSEWLIETALRNTRMTEREIYVREDDKFNFDSSINKTIQDVAATIPITILALPRLANNNMFQALRILDVVVNRVILFDSTKTETILGIASKRLSEDANLRKRVVNIVKNLDFSIQDFNVTQRNITKQDIDQLPEQVRQFIDKSAPANEFRTEHNVYNKNGQVTSKVEFDYHNNESRGTQNLILFTTMLVDAMDQGLTVIVDEFGSNFHPFITKAIVDLFLSFKHDAQLIAFTHETYLLRVEGLIKKDSIWFIEKNKLEESTLIALSEYKMRSDARLQKQYLEGRFGAVPLVIDTEG